MAEPGLGNEFTELGYLGGVFTKLAPAPSGCRRGGPADANGPPLRFGSPGTADIDVSSPDVARGRRQALLGRLAAVFYVGSGLLGLVTLPLPAPG